MGSHRELDKNLAIATEEGGLGTMICKGDLVQDWQGRAGIAVATAGPPATDRIPPIVGSHFDNFTENTTWWSVALFSGAVVNSPTPLSIPGEEPAEPFCYGNQTL